MTFLTASSGGISGAASSGSGAVAAVLALTLDRDATICENRIYYEEVSGVSQHGQNREATVNSHIHELRVSS